VARGQAGGLDVQEGGVGQEVGVEAPPLAARQAGLEEARIAGVEPCPGLSNAIEPPRLRRLGRTLGQPAEKRVPRRQAAAPEGGLGFGTDPLDVLEGVLEQRAAFRSG
jgi:hypothetical protein